MTIPSRWRDYPCEDYFGSGWASGGCWDEPSQTMVIVPAADIEERESLGFLVVGRPGVDGIEFGYRKDMRGMWAYYPSDQEFVLMAPTVSELVEGWLSGWLSV